MREQAVDWTRAASTFFTLSLVLALLLVTNAGCSVFMAAKQPPRKDLTVLKPGTPRSLVVTELGAPIWSGEKGGEKVDWFAFTQGYSKGAKAGRAFFHGAADVFTLGLWEVAATPIESVASGRDMKVEVIYDKRDLVKSAEVLGRKATSEGHGSGTESTPPASAEPTEP